MGTRRWSGEPDFAALLQATRVFNRDLIAEKVLSSPSTNRFANGAGQVSYEKETAGPALCLVLIRQYEGNDALSDGGIGRIWRVEVPASLKCHGPISPLTAIAGLPSRQSFPNLERRRAAMSNWRFTFYQDRLNAAVFSAGLVMTTDLAIPTPRGL